MLGPNGQSFGCVSFKDYQAFLRAFKKGEGGRSGAKPLAYIDKTSGRSET